MGTVKTWSGFMAPNQYVFAYGQPLLRATYPEAFAALTSEQNVTCSASSPTLTGVADTTQLAVGTPVESTCFSGTVTVVSTTSTTVVVSGSATVSTTTTARFFPWGNGNGTTSFNVPDLRGRVVAGPQQHGRHPASTLTSQYFLADPNAIGVNGGSQNHTQTVAEMAQHNHIATTTNSASTFNLTLNSNKAVIDDTAFCCSGSAGASVTGTSGVTNNPSVTIPNGGITLNTAITNQGLSDPFTVVQPTTTFNYIIKIVPDSNPNSFFGVASIGGMYGVLECGIGITCAGNTISAVASTFVYPDAVLYNTSPINLSSTDQVVAIDMVNPLTTTINLPPVSGRNLEPIRIVDWSSSLSTNVITINPNGTETIFKSPTWTVYSTASSPAMITLYPSITLNGWYIQ